MYDITKFIDLNDILIQYMSLRVAVIDVTKRLYPILMNMSDIEVVLLYGPSDSEIDDSFKLGYTKYIHKLEPSTWNKTFVSKEDIIKYRSTQLKIERFAQRYNMIPSYATSQYYHSLAFWNYHLSDETIDCLLLGGKTEHGSFLDSVPIDVAKSKNIPVFLFDILYSTPQYAYMSILCENTGKYVKLKDLDPSISLVNIDDVIFPSSEQTADDSRVLDILDNNSLVNNMIIKKICNVVKKMIILHSRVCVRFLSIFGMQVNYPKYYEKDIYIVVMIYALFSSFLCKYRKEKEYTAAMELDENPYMNLLRNIRYQSGLRRYYRKHSKRSIDPETDGILYALHFEPEASIMNRTIYNAQIYNIEMLSSVLPQGWKIFVKEHPHQLKKYGYVSLYMYKQVPIYRRNAYYDRLLEIPNVELVDDRISSSKLINAIEYPKIHAISTINGTISAESLRSGKPVILFGSESTVYDDMSGLFKISDTDSLQNAIDALVLGKIVVDPQKIENIREYLIKVPTNNYYKELMQISDKALLTLITNSKKIAQV